MKFRKLHLILLMLLLIVVTSCKINHDNKQSTTTTNVTTETTSNELTTTTEDTTTTTEPVVEVCEEDGTHPEFKMKKCTSVLTVIPDTQYYTETYRQAEIFFSQTNWIADHYNEYNIKFVAHVGDLVRHAYSKPQFEFADKAMKVLDDAGIAYGVTVGNHDVNGNMGEYYKYRDNQRSADELYLKFFSKERTSKVSEQYGGHSENGWNSYYYFEGNGRKYMVLFLDYAPSEETIQWANQVLEANKHLPTILVTHNLVKPVGNTGSAVIDGAECEYIWNNVIKNNNQIFLTINGHHTGSGYMVRKNASGNDVIMIVVDYQGYYRGGNGYMRLLEFDETENKIYNFTFSPYVINMPEKARSEQDIPELTSSDQKYAIDINFAERLNFGN